MIDNYNIFYPVCVELIAFSSLFTRVMDTICVELCVPLPIALL